MGLVTGPIDPFQNGGNKTTFQRLLISGEKYTQNSRGVSCDLPIFWIFFS